MRLGLTDLKISVSSPGGTGWMEVRPLLSSARGTLIEPLPMSKHWPATIGITLRAISHHCLFNKMLRHSMSLMGLLLTLKMNSKEHVEKCSRKEFYTTGLTIKGS